MEPVVPSLSGSEMRLVFGGSGSGRICPGCASFSMTTTSHCVRGQRLLLEELDAAPGEVGTMQRRYGDGDGLHAGTLPIVHSARVCRTAAAQVGYLSGVELACVRRRQV